MTDLVQDGAIVAVGASASHPRRAAPLVARALARVADQGPDLAGVVAVRERARGWWGPTEALSAEAVEGLDGPVAIGAVARVADDPGWRVPAAGIVSSGPVALAVVGRLAGDDALRRALLQAGGVLTDRSTSGLVLGRLGRSGRGRVLHRLIDALWDVPAAFAAVLAAQELLVGVRDPFGLRPLVIGRVGDAPALATDPVALYALGGEPVRDVAPGEMVVWDAHGEVSLRPFRPRAPRVCAQEAWQLLDDGVVVDGRDTRAVRESLGLRIAEEAPAEVDVVVPLDERAAAAARATASALRVSWAPARTADGRIVGSEVARQRVLLLAVGGAGQPALRDAVEALRRAGAAAVHLRLLAPRPVRPCPFGRVGPAADLPEPDALRRRWSLESVAWTSAAGAGRAWAETGADTPCTACVGGALPVEPDPEEDQLALFTGPQTW